MNLPFGTPGWVILGLFSSSIWRGHHQCNEAKRKNKMNFLSDKNDSIL